jgi:Tol biopolymer transport system component
MTRKHASKPTKSAHSRCRLTQSVQKKERRNTGEPYADGDPARPATATNASSGAPAISADGQAIVFESLASNLECGRRSPVEQRDENLLTDIDLFDRRQSTFVRVSGKPRPWWAPSVRPSIDRSGDVIAFSSRHPTGANDMAWDFDLFVQPWTVVNRQ